MQTGQCRGSTERPGLFIRTEGAKRQPVAAPVKGPTLRDPKPGPASYARRVRPPIGIRDLADAVEVDAGYVSRVLGVLEQELLVIRAPRGPVTDVEWEGVLRRAASTYSLFDSNQTTTGRELRTGALPQ